MKPFVSISTGLLSLLLVACGSPKQKKPATEKPRQDSSRKISLQQLRKEQAHHDSLANRIQLFHLKSELLDAELRLDSLMEYKLGRSLAEEEKQLLDQKKRITTLKRQIEVLEE